MLQLDPAVVCQEIVSTQKLKPTINYKALFSISVNYVSNVQDTVCKSESFEVWKHFFFFLFQFVRANFSAHICLLICL